MFDEFVSFVRQVYNSDDFLPLHEPRFRGNEKKYLSEVIDSTFVSYLGDFVKQAEQNLAELAGVKHVITTVNGTTAIHIALIAAGAKENTEVITQPLTFVATCNAIAYTGATSVFVDCEEATLGMSSESLRQFLECNVEVNSEGVAINKSSGKQIVACMPVHVFGHACNIEEIVALCKSYNIRLVEDSAEGVGSYYKGKHLGSFGDLGVMSFNGNKTITCGGGGAVLTNDDKLAGRIKHIATTAKVPHTWEYIHDEVGFNYRMPNLNAGLLVAQLEQLSAFVEIKRALACRYEKFFENFEEANFITEPKNSKSNYWLNAIIFSDPDRKNEFLTYTNDKGIMTRPCWRLMNDLPMFSGCQVFSDKVARHISERLVNITSSVI